MDKKRRVIFFIIVGFLFLIAGYWMWVDYNWRQLDLEQAIADFIFYGNAFNKIEY